MAHHRRRASRHPLRDLDFVSHWITEAAADRFDIDSVHGYVAGMATYVLAGELALCRVLHGELPRPSFPDALMCTSGDS